MTRGYNSAMGYSSVAGRPPAGYMIPRGGSYITYDGTGAVSRMTFRLPVGKSITVDMGDGTSYISPGQGPSSSDNIDIDHTYSTPGPHKVTFTGDVDAITVFVWKSDLDIKGDVAFFSSWKDLEILQLYGGSYFGKMDSLRTLKKMIYIYANGCDLEGDISYIAENIQTRLWVQDNEKLKCSFSRVVTIKQSFYDHRYFNLDLTKQDCHNIIDSIHDGLAARPTTGYLYMYGNSAIDPAWQTKAAEIGAHGWSVVTD